MFPRRSAEVRELRRHRPGAVMVISESATQAGRTAAVGPQGSVVGRDVSCDLVLASERVSRRHALVRVRDGEYVIEDLGSTNGTRVNGEPVTYPRVLRDGDGLAFADVEVEFRLTDVAETPAMQSLPAPDEWWEPDQRTDPFGRAGGRPGPRPLRGLRGELRQSDGFSLRGLFLAVLGSVVGASLTSAFGTGAWGALAGATVGPVVSTTFTAKRAGEKGRVRNVTISLLSVGALLITVSGFSFADHIAGRSILPGTDDRAATFPVPNPPPAKKVAAPGGPGIEVDPSPEALECGDVAVGSNAPCLQPVTITSEGGSALDITTVEVTGSDQRDFTASDECVGKALDPGETCEMRVHFQPTMAGQRTATLVIHQNLPRPDRGTQVRLSGNGADNPDTCIQGYVWREAVPDDHVCVTPETRDQTTEDNRLATSRLSPTGGDFGPETCIEGYVWREAAPDDHVCVTPETRDQTAEDNRLANSRTGGCRPRHHLPRR